jgi:hypothetical protein
VDPDVRAAIWTQGKFARVPVSRFPPEDRLSDIGLAQGQSIQLSGMGAATEKCCRQNEKQSYRETLVMTDK